VNDEYKGMRMRFIILVSILIILAGFGCRENAVNTDGGSRPEYLTAEDVGVTDVWLRIKLPFSRTQKPVTLKRDTVTILHSTITAPDTLVLDERLLHNHTYTYTLISYIGSMLASEARLTITTMDTTSHNFTWEILTIGDGASIGFRDVAIINDTLAYAVGDINVKDSLGNRIYPPYNVARWDGHRWELSTTKDSGYGYGINYSIYAFHENDIWVGGSIPKHWDGDKWTFYGSKRGYQGGFWIRKIWGTSSLDLYVVGDGGNIWHYNGANWQKLESGTTLDIEDIWGATNSKTGELEILAVASKRYDNQNRQILKISGTSVTTLPDTAITTSITGVWFDAGRRYYVTGGDVFRKWTINGPDPWKRDIWATYFFYKYKIRGTAINDIAIACDNGDILHYNGLTWKSYYNETRLNYGNYNSVAMRGNLIIAVGDNYGSGVIAVGRR
jgi:hypothetical protein